MNQFKTNYEKVGEFNNNFGVKEHDTTQVDILQKESDTILQRLSLIQEEFNELKDAIQQDNFIEVVDALTDMLYVIHGFGRYIGVNLDQSFDIVHNSNMSKLCTNEEEAIKTVEWYKQQFKLNKVPYDTPTYRKSKNSNYWIVYNKSTNKILKSINYKPATRGLTNLIKK